MKPKGVIEEPVVSGEIQSPNLENRKSAIANHQWPDVPMKQLMVNFFRQEYRDGLQEVPVLVRKRRGLVAVNIDLAQDAVLVLDGHNNLRARFQAARQVPRVGVDVVHDKGLAGGSRRAADTLI